jgi:hypothetical protein
VRRRLAAAAVLALAGPAAAGAVELPKLAPGRWELTRTVTTDLPGMAPSTTTITGCQDPAEAMRARDAQLRQVGCTLSDPVRSGERYTIDWRCDGSQGMKGRGQTVITVDGDSVFRTHVASTLRMQGRDVRSTEELVAKRVGDCPKAH